jgi:anionic cell wall polymer biosynthesis LytR-Cps2A-Psr (LCP) family protein
MSENIVPEEQEEEKTIVFGNKSIIAIVTLIIIVSLTAFFGAYTARSNVQKANTQLEQMKASTGAKIDALLNKRASNRNKWSEEQKNIDSAMIIQAKLNSSTEQIEAELEKMNISIISR